MEISSFKIEQKTFKKSFRGLNEEDVRWYLKQLAQQIDQLAAENDRLKRNLAEKERRIREYKNNEGLLRNTLITTQDAVERIKANAEKEAQIIVAEAELKAERILNKTQHRLAQIHEDIVELKRQKTQLEMRLRSTIESHLRMLDIEKEEGPAREDLEEKVKYLRQP